MRVVYRKPLLTYPLARIGLKTALMPCSEQRELDEARMTAGAQSKRSQKTIVSNEPKAGTPRLVAGKPCLHSNRIQVFMAWAY